MSADGFQISQQRQALFVRRIFAASHDLKLIMKRIFKYRFAFVVVLSLLILISFNSYSQFSFEYDSIPMETGFFYKEVDSAFSLPKDNLFEIRLSAFSMRYCDEQLFILTKNDCGWFCYMYKMDPNNHNPKIIELKSKVIAQDLWNKLKSLDILKLEGLYKYSEEIDRDSSWNIQDGKWYTFQILDRKGHRELHYHSPRAYANYFIRIPDFAKADKIIREIYQTFGLNYY